MRVNMVDIHRELPKLMSELQMISGLKSKQSNLYKQSAFKAFKRYVAIKQMIEDFAKGRGLRDEWGNLGTVSETAEEAE